MGQNLSRHHQRPLKASRHRSIEGDRRHDCFPTPNIPLQKPLHVLRTFQVMADFIGHALLRIRQFKGQFTSKFFQALHIVIDRQAVFLGFFASLQSLDLHLEQKELFKNHPPLRLMTLLGIFGKVHRKHRGFPIQQAIFFDQ